MIQIEFSPSDIPFGQPTHVNLNISNTSAVPVSKLFLAISFPQPVKFLAGARRIEISHLKPGETHTVSLQLMSEQEGEFVFTSTNFSYRKGGIGQRIKDLQVPITFIKPIKVPEPLTDRTSKQDAFEAFPQHLPTEKGRKAFISYSRKDEAFARRLANTLSTLGMDIWLDVDDIRAGVKWSTAIQQALSASEIMFVILSPDSMASVNVEDEWNYFLDQGKLVIPILWRPCDIHFQLSRLQYIDFSNQDFKGAFGKLLIELERLNAVVVKSDPLEATDNSTKANLGKIRILFLSANPISTSRLRLDEEIREIDNRLLLAKYRERFDIKEAWAVRHKDLSQALQRYEPQIVHFSGHGNTSGEIVVEDDHGNAHPVPAESLARLFKVFKKHVQCVILNACWSANQADAIAREIDVVIGMRNSVGDKAAINFASGFYQALGYGQSIKDAFELGCVEIDLALLDEENTPKIITKNNIDIDNL